MRIVSLLPSSTEIACALGAADEIVGISHECDYPESISGRPILTSSKINVDQLSAEIDRDVRRTLKDALAVYDVDTEGLAEVRPDVVLTQDLCDVCAVSIRDVEAALVEIAQEGVQLVSLKPTRLDDHDGAHGVFGDVERVAKALGRPDEGTAVAQRLRERCAGIRERSRSAVEASGGTRPRVLTIEWIDPVMVGGTWMPELVEIAGGEALVTSPGDHAPTLTADELGELRPDVVLVKPCGFDLARTAREAGALRELMTSMPWPAVETGRVFVADGNAFFNRPGPRLVESAEILAAIT
ncbi:MAG: cobalamin-binding protein, partial [Planctomycetota bacterium]